LKGLAGSLPTLARRIFSLLVVGYTRHIIGQGGVITWDVPIQKSGLIPAAFVNQLRRIGTGR
jgi:hypothetical protein